MYWRCICNQSICLAIGSVLCCLRGLVNVVRHALDPHRTRGSTSTCGRQSPVAGCVQLALRYCTTAKGSVDLLTTGWRQVSQHNVCNQRGWFVCYAYVVVACAVRCLLCCMCTCLPQCCLCSWQPWVVVACLCLVACLWDTGMGGTPASTGEGQHLVWCCIELPLASPLAATYTPGSIWVVGAVC